MLFDNSRRVKLMADWTSNFVRLKRQRRAIIIGQVPPAMHSFFFITVTLLLYRIYEILDA
jgi:hypothetical protein